MDRFGSFAFNSVGSYKSTEPSACCPAPPRLGPRANTTKRATKAGIWGGSEERTFFKGGASCWPPSPHAEQSPGAWRVHVLVRRRGGTRSRGVAQWRRGALTHGEGHGGARRGTGHGGARRRGGAEPSHRATPLRRRGDEAPWPRAAASSAKHSAFSSSLRGEPYTPQFSRAAWFATRRSARRVPHLRGFHASAGRGTAPPSALCPRLRRAPQNDRTALSLLQRLSFPSSCPWPSSANGRILCVNNARRPRTPPDVGPFFRRNFSSRGIGFGQNKPWLTTPDLKPTPGWLGGAIARSDANPHPGRLPLGRRAEDRRAGRAAESQSRRATEHARARQTIPPRPL